MIAWVFALLAALAGYDKWPVCVMVGDYKCAPIKIELRCMTPDQRVGWWDTHQDPTCTWVVTLKESGRE